MNIEKQLTIVSILLICLFTLAIRRPVSAETWHLPTDFASIQEAINSASAGDVIMISGMYTENVTIDKNVSLVGEGAAVTVIDGGRAGSVVTIDNNVSAAISNVTIRNGFKENVGASSTGAGVYNQGNVTLSNVIITNNEAGNTGGGIRNSVGTLQLINTHVLSNTANFGAGIYNIRGTTILSRSTVADNRGESVTTSSVTRPSFGGGIMNRGGTILVEASVVSGNIATLGGGIYSELGSVTIRNTTLQTNTAVKGGALNLNVGDNTVEIAHSEIISNRSTEDGGGIFSEEGAVINIIQTNFFGNVANEKGGAIADSESDIQIMDSRFENNTAATSGGGIQAYTATLTMTNSTVVGNSAAVSGAGINLVSTDAAMINSAIENNLGARWGNDVAMYNSAMSITGTIGASNGTIYAFNSTFSTDAPTAVHLANVQTTSLTISIWVSIILLTVATMRSWAKNQQKS